MSKKPIKYNQGSYVCASCGTLFVQEQGHILADIEFVHIYVDISRNKEVSWEEEKTHPHSSQHAKKCQGINFSPNVQIKCKSYPTLHHFLKQCERFTSCSPGHLHFFLGLGGTIRMKSGTYIFYGGRLYHQSKTLVFALFQGFLLPIILSTASPNVSSLFTYNATC